jgi:A/G-specific adenine glycosylase
MIFPTQNLLNWYDLNKRELPWRNNKNPYFVWLSEIILQQTRVQQGWYYYLRFITDYPTILDLAQASEQAVLKNWQGLGYYSRARNMHETARRIAFEKNCIFPNQFSDILTLKGVGAYTAAAIASIAFEEKIAAVDGNVYRVLSRFYANSTPIDSTQGKKIFFEYAQKNIDVKRPGDFNQAMMELGACICTPKKPLCFACPLQESCAGFALQEIQHFPVKNKKIKAIDRFFTFFFLHDTDHILLYHRKEKDIWKGLFTFPALNSFEEMPINNTFIYYNFFEQAIEKVEYPLTHHLLTHQKLHIQFKSYFFKRLPVILKNEYLPVPKNQLKNYAFPKPIVEFLEQKGII